MKAYIVVDLGWGDAGKGKITSALCDLRSELLQLIAIPLGITSHGPDTLSTTFHI